MDLTTAGILSGAGNAGTQALQQVGQVAGNSFIQQERQKWEDARLQLQEEYKTRGQQAEFDQAKGLLATKEAGDDRRLQKTQDFELGRDQQRLGAELTKTQLVQDYASGEKAKERTSSEGIHAADRASKEGLAKAENAMMSKHYDELGKYYAKLGAAAVGKSGGGEGPVDKRQKEFLESVTKPLIEHLHMQLELASPEEKEAIQEKIDQVVAEARGVANVGAPEAPIAGQIKDPYRKLLNPAVPGGR